MRCTVPWRWALASMFGGSVALFGTIPAAPGVINCFRPGAGQARPFGGNAAVRPSLQGEFSRGAGFGAFRGGMMGPVGIRR